MENNKPEATDASEDVVEETESDQTVDEGNDTGLESIFGEEAGQEDVAGKGEELTLAELNTLLKRDFKTKAEALKSIEGLKKLSGDQEAIKERKAQKEASSVKEELAELKKDLATKDFLIETPTAKPYLKVLEAYAKDNKMTLSEAWASDEFKPFAESSRKTVITPNNRINPAVPKIPSDLVDNAKQGSHEAQLELVDKWFAGEK